MILIDLHHHKENCIVLHEDEWQKNLQSQEDIQESVCVGVYDAPIGEETLSQWTSSGIHPMEIDETEVPKQLEYLKNFIQHENALAIGECGMDNRAETPTRKQRLILESQLNLALEHNKPAILHCVGHHLEMFEVLKKYPTLKTVMHGFNKNKEWAEKFLKLNAKLSFGKDLLRYDHVQAYFKELPLDHIFLETDDQELDIKMLYQVATELKKMDLRTFANQIAENFHGYFLSK